MTETSLGHEHARRPETGVIGPLATTKLCVGELMSRACAARRCGHRHLADQSLRRRYRVSMGRGSVPFGREAHGSMGRPAPGTE